MAYNYPNWNTPTRSYGLSQDGQGRWYESLSSTQGFTEQRPNVDQSQKEEQKKKKCRGNRKEQHRRRRARRQQQNLNNNGANHVNGNGTIAINGNNGLNSDEEEMEENSYAMNSQHLSRRENKRKRPEVNKDDMNINRSLSQLSIPQKNAKKTKPTSCNHRSQNGISNGVNYNHEAPQQHLSANNSMHQYKPQYLRVSDKIFKQMLSNAVINGGKIIQSLNADDKIQLVRQMTEATNNLYYFDLQRHLWQEYHNICMKEGAKRTTKLSKSFAKQHRTWRTYGFSKHIIGQRQKAIERQVQQTINELQGYMTKLEQNIRYCNHLLIQLLYLMR